jgi:nickel superoxide dismutase
MKTLMTKFLRLLATPVEAHCDLPCGVYDPAQARIEAESIYRILKKYAELDDANKTRALSIKDERAELVKHHLWVLWTDYFKEEHVQKFPELHELFWKVTKAAGAVKKSVEPKDGEVLNKLIDEIGAIFAKTKPGYDYQAIVKNLKAV